MTIKQFLDDCLAVFDMPLLRFVRDHGKAYTVGPHSFAGSRGTPNECYMNATHLAWDQPNLTYVEGKVSVHGVPIEHAWCVDGRGFVVDPTLDGSTTQEYFGVPFRTDYVRKATLTNGYYGLLDIMSARKTLPKLIELGLDDGQQWLIDLKRSGKRVRS